MAIDLYQTGVSGLMAAQAQLATTGHNIANVNTEGYHRQRVEQITSTALLQGGLHLGTGTQLSDVTRLYHEYAFKDLLVNNTEKAEAVQLHQHLSYLDSSLSNLNKGITTSMDDLYAAINAIVDNPGDLGNREIMLAKAGDLASQFNQLYDSLTQEMNINSREIGSRVKFINETTGAIAALNQEIQQAGINGTPNDLLDKRDKLIKELSDEVKITTVKDANTGMITVLLGGREPLVSGPQAYQLQERAGSPDPTQTELYLQHPARPDSATRLDGASLGGELGAVFRFRDQVLPQTLSDMGKAAVAVADVFNQIQAQGVDLNGQPGQNLFNDINSPQAQASRFLTSNAGVAGAVAITDTGALTGDEYELRYQGGNYLFTNLTTGKSETVTPDGDGKLNLDGFSLTLTGTPANEDRMLVRPTRLGTSELGLAIGDGKQIAASSLVMATANGDNPGNSRLALTVTDPADADFPTRTDPLVVTLDAAGNYQVFRKSDPSTPLAGGVLDPNDPVIQVAGLDITVSGQAGAPLDRFEVEYAAGSGNNANALVFAEVKSRQWLNGGRSTLSQSLDQTTVRVGSQAYNQRLKAETASAAYDQSFNRVQSLVGVNLDEEAANLLRFQQSYMASARVVTVASETMNTLLQIR
jgi:flagellar hook-associated protein 1 FlgK